MKSIINRKFPFQVEMEIIIRKFPFQVEMKLEEDKLAYFFSETRLWAEEQNFDYRFQFEIIKDTQNFNDYYLISFHFQNDDELLFFKMKWL